MLGNVNFILRKIPKTRNLLFRKNCHCHEKFFMNSIICPKSRTLLIVKRNFWVKNHFDKNFIILENTSHFHSILLQNVQIFIPLSQLRKIFLTRWFVLFWDFSHPLDLRVSVFRVFVVKKTKPFLHSSWLILPWNSFPVFLSIF